MGKILEIRKKLTSLNYVQFIGLQTALGLLVAIVQSAITFMFEISLPLDRFEGHDYTFISYQPGLMVSAIVETLLFQYLPFVITKRVTLRKKFRPTRYILYSSAWFGLFHIIATQCMMPFTIIKVFFSALSGVVLSVSFYIFRRKKQLPVLSVSLIHYMINTIILSTGVLIDSLTNTLG